MRGPQNGWLAGSHFSEFSPGCLHAFRAACMHVNGIFSQSASQPASQGPRPPDMARIVKMRRLPGARMPPQGRAR